jgi:hypothetical protein
MPGHEPGIDFVDLRLQLRIFLGLGRAASKTQATDIVDYARPL